LLGQFIYKLDGDTLKLGSFGSDEVERPRSFDAPEVTVTEWVRN